MPVPVCSEAALGLDQIWNFSAVLCVQSVSPVVASSTVYLLDTMAHASGGPAACRYFSGTNQYSLLNMHWWNDTQARLKATS